MLGLNTIDFFFSKNLHENSTLFSAFSLSRCIEIGHRQSCPVDECSAEKREGLGMEKIHRGRNLTVDYTI